MYAFTKPADFEFSREGTKVGRTADAWGDLTRTEKDNSQARELTMYLCTLLRASFHRSGVNRLCARSALVSHEQTRIPRYYGCNHADSFGQR